MPISRKFKKRKEIKNSFKLSTILLQLISKHSGINKVVNKIKNNEIPSTPIVKFKFKLGNQKKVVTNWKEAIDFSKKPHNNKEKLKVKHVTFKAVIFNNFLLLEGINKINKKNKYILLFIQNLKRSLLKSLEKTIVIFL